MRGVSRLADRALDVTKVSMSARLLVYRASVIKVMCQP
jgi:hypothetical protein